MQGESQGEQARRASTELVEPEPPAALLNEAQRRAVTVALRQFERALSTVEHVLAGGECGRLYRDQADFTPEQRARLEALVRLARQRLDALAERLALPIEVLSGRRIVAAVCSSAWETLSDAAPRVLRRYGAVHPDLEQRIGPDIEALAELSLLLARVAQEGPPDTAAEAAEVKSALGNSPQTT
jgi:hypothetical protein